MKLKNTNSYFKRIKNPFKNKNIMVRYKIFQKNLINYNQILNFSYTNLNFIPKIKNIHINFKETEFMKNEFVFVDYIYLTETFSNNQNLHNLTKTSQKGLTKKITNIGSKLEKKNFYNFLEFLVVFIFPKQIKKPIFTFFKPQKNEVHVVCTLYNWNNIPKIYIDKITKFNKPVQITIKVNAFSISQVKSFLTMLNFPIK